MSYSELLKGRHSENGRIYFVTTVLARRDQPLFYDLTCAHRVIFEMRRLHDKSLVSSLAWIVMPDHLHWLFQLGEAESLGMVMKKLKARSAQSINAYLGRTGPVWQKAYFDRAVRKEEDFLGIARYIIANPLRAGLVSSVKNYPHWDAAWL